VDVAEDPGQPIDRGGLGHETAGELGRPDPALRRAAGRVVGSRGGDQESHVAAI
jgi:hypothetical protein